MTGLHLEWATGGLDAVERGDLVVVVDVLSFTTTVSIAADRGIAVLPFPWRDRSAAAYAAEHDAVLAGPRGAAGPTLSPASMLRTPARARVVLPSPNGATIAAAFAGSGATVVAACLRNAVAVGRLVAERLDGPARVLVAPAGERWPDGSLRPAAEDLWAAGAVIAAAGRTDAESVEATTARLAASACSHAALRDCVSGRALVDAGWADDVELAAARDVSDVVPILQDGAFRPRR